MGRTLAPCLKGNLLFTTQPGGSWSTRLLILQVSRLLHTDRGIRKTRQTFQLQREKNIPTFSDHEGNIEQTPYILSGGVLHVGQVVTAGHYQAFYFLETALTHGQHT